MIGQQTKRKDDTFRVKKTERVMIKAVPETENRRFIGVRSMAKSLVGKYRIEVALKIDLIW
jgi:hypothetical protein